MSDDNAQDVIKRLGSVEDEMAEIQTDHATYAGRVKKGKEFIKTFHKVLVRKADGDTAAMKEINGTAILHDAEEYTYHLTNLERFGELESRFAFLEARKSTLQSILGFMKEELRLEGFGKAAGQAGQHEPS